MDFFLVIFRVKVPNAGKLGFYIVIDCTGTLQIRRNYSCPRTRLEKPLSFCYSLKFVQSSHSLKFNLELFSK